MASLSPTLVDRVLSRYPLPIADAVGALAATDSLHERRDRVVEVFRTGLRFLGTLSLGARIQFGPGPGGDPDDARALLRALRRQGLTDGQWVGLARELTRPFRDTPEAHPLPELVHLFHHTPAWKRCLDALLRMRKAETIAHGTTGESDDVEALLTQRLPTLERFLESTAPLWERLSLVAPLPINSEDTHRQRARLLMGDTPSRGRWRRLELAKGTRLTPGEPILVDATGRGILSLGPVALLRKPSPESIDELFLLDGSHRKKALFVAFPSMAEHREEETWPRLMPLLLGDEDELGGLKVDGLSRPFRGLESFGPEHASLFFGREGESEALANRLRRHPMLTVTGPSGSGKSSLLKAGVLPLLPHVRVCVFRPGADPVLNLMRSLREGLPEDLQAPGGVDLQGLRDRPEALTEALHTLSRADGRPILFLVDQSEEVFTLCGDKAAQRLFASHLACLGSNPGAGTRVVLSIREDFFSRLATLEPLRGIFSREVEVVTTPDREALLRTVVLPAQRFGYTFEDMAMVEEMVSAVEGEPAALTLLQFCADRIWEGRDRTWKRLTVDAYRALGGVEGALASHAETVLEGLTPAQQSTARALLLRLVTGDETRAVVLKRQLLEAAEDPEDGARVLDRFIDGRLLILRESDTEGGEAVLELAHEALIRHWERLKGWLAEDREGRRLLIALQQAARSWEERGRPKGLLWRGETLADYQRWRRRSDGRLTDTEGDFVAASLGEAQRSRVLKRWAIGGTLLGALVMSALLYGLWQRAEDAEVAAIRQVVQLLGGAAMGEIRDGNPVEGILLSLEASRVLREHTLDPEGPEAKRAKTALAESVAMTLGEVILKEGEPILSLSYGEDATLRGERSFENLRWELSDPTTTHITPRRPPPLSAPEPGIIEITALGGEINAQGHPDGSITLSLQGGDIQTFLSHQTGSALTAMAFNADGTKLATAWADGSLWQWDLDGQHTQRPCDLVGRNLSDTEWRRYFPERLASPTCPDTPDTLTPGQALISLTLPGVDGQLLWLNGQRHALTPEATLAQLPVPGGKRHALRYYAPGCPSPQALILNPAPGAHLRAKLGAPCPRDGSLQASAQPPGIPLQWVNLPRGKMQVPFAASSETSRTLELQSFDILQTPVTVAQYLECVDAGLCPEATGRVLTNGGCNLNHPGRLDHPMNCISWDDARAFCQARGGALPSEAQWTYAARSGGKDKAYPWGDEAATCARAVLDDGRGVGCGQGRTWAVCSLEGGETEQGLCDMAGGVYEWLEDCHHPGGGLMDGPKDGQAYVTECSGDFRLLIGGAIDDGPEKLAQGNNGLRAFPGGKAEWAGFRCIRPSSI